MSDGPIYVEAFIPEIPLGPLLALEWLSVREARQERFEADHLIEYAYGKEGRSKNYVAGPLSPVVRTVMECVNQFLERRAWGPMNGCFLNRYDNDHHALGWHADDFEGMDHTKAVVVVSFGQAREIWWRPKGQKGIVPQNQRQLLAHGSLFVMPPGFQHTHDHRIPKGGQAMGARVSMTFRAFRESLAKGA